MNKRILVISIFVLVFAVGFVSAAPNGAEVDPGDSSNGNVTSPNSVSAVAGNITEVDIDGSSITQSWQGYFGNVSGALQLTDGESNVMYNWTSLQAVGEVYASVNESITWTSVECFNYTAVNRFNLTMIEEDYNINPSDVDGVDETFSLNNHEGFYVGAIEFSTGECKNAKILGAGGAATFDEVLLIDTSKNATVFTSIMNDNTPGFDGATHDFEMLVLEDGHLGNTASVLYYFYVELG